MEQYLAQYGKWISYLHRNFQMFINAELADVNITSSEFYFFPLMVRGQRPMIQDEFVEHLQIDKAAVARTVKSLEGKGYVVRDYHPDNRRKKIVSLTPKGKEVSWRIFEAITKWNMMIEESIDSDELKVVSRVLEKMSENVK